MLSGNKVRGITALIFAVLINTAAIAQGTKVDPSRYPGSVEEPNSEITAGKEYYSKDTYDKVNAYYIQIYGEAMVEGGASYYKVRLIRDYAQSDSIKMAFNTTQKEQLIKIMPETDYDNYYVAQALAALKRAWIDMQMSTAMKRDPMEFANDPKVRRTYNRFEHLLKRFFAKTGKTTSSGKSKYKGIEQILFEKYFKQPEDDRMAVVKEMQLEYLQAVEAGDMTRAAQISKDINELTTVSSEDPAETWNKIIEFLVELDKLAFRTRVIVYD